MLAFRTPLVRLAFRTIGVLRPLLPLPRQGRMTCLALARAPDDVVPETICQRIERFVEFPLSRRSLHRLRIRPGLKERELADLPLTVDEATHAYSQEPNRLGQCIGQERASHSRNDFPVIGRFRQRELARARGITARPFLSAPAETPLQDHGSRKQALSTQAAGDRFRVGQDRRLEHLAIRHVVFKSVLFGKRNGFAMGLHLAHILPASEAANGLTPIAEMTA